MDQLNRIYGIPDNLEFIAGPNGMRIVTICHSQSQARVSLYGGQIIGFQPTGQPPVLWLSRHSLYERGRAIRGGIPICWPWFGAHPSDPAMPAHGFTRVMDWEVRHTAVTPSGEIQLILGLRDNPSTLALWNHPFDLELSFTVGRELGVDLMIGNTGRESFTCTMALHTYLAVSELSQSLIRGLEGIRYRDALDQFKAKIEQDPIRIDSEVDRIYEETVGPYTVEDPGWQRRIVIDKTGSRSTVVWNPWIDKACRLKDFGNDEYRKMVCVETLKAGQDSLSLPAGACRHIGTRIRTESCGPGSET